GEDVAVDIDHARCSKDPYRLSLNRFARKDYGALPSGRGSLARRKNQMASSVTIVKTAGKYSESLKPSSQCCPAKLLRIRPVSRSALRTNASGASHSQDFADFGFQVANANEI